MLSIKKKIRTTYKILIPLNKLYFRRHYWKNSPVKPSCDLECKKRMICDLRSGRSHDRKTFCQEIESRIDANHPTGWKAWLYNGLALSYVLKATSFSWVMDFTERNFDYMNKCIV